MKKQTRLLATSDQKGPLIRSGHNYESEKRDAGHLLDGPTLRQTEKRTPASKLKNCAKKKGSSLRPSAKLLANTICKILR